MLMVKNVGKPCEGKPHARFDEGKVGLGPTDPLYPVLLNCVAIRLNEETKLYSVVSLMIEILDNNGIMC
jgi:hypothetical protein